MQRRHFLVSAAAASLAAATGPTLIPTAVQAQAVDYRALVCIFLYGGNDGLNMVTPYDTTRHAMYSAVRGAVALPRASLVQLNADYGLHPSLAALGTAWTEGALAPIFNVGPLFQPLTKDEYRNFRARGKTVPDSLFSHSDQQIQWETAHHDILLRTGWGGRAAQARSSLVVSVGGNGRFGLSDMAAPLVLPGPGSSFGIEGNFANQNARRKTALELMHAEAAEQTMHNAFATQQRDAFTVADRLAPTLRINPRDNASEPINAAFAPLIDGNRNLTTGLARQLYQIAKLIEYRSTAPLSVGSTRHVYFAQLGGFDTHGDQVASGDATAGQHAGLMKQLGDAMACFYQATKDLGLAGNVTTFTQSDFGRTFASNSSLGTDHAWGNNQLVMGAGVVGGTHGAYPELVLGGPDDVGVADWEKQGRWIPKISVDQYAATMLRWWGLDDSQVRGALPNLGNFGSSAYLNFMRT